MDLTAPEWVVMLRFCQGGNRDENDERNMLYKQVVRITDVMRPCVVVMENVLSP